jgi:hypothetical protein
MSHEGDIVLIHIKDQPTMYARIEFVDPDIKKGWYKVTLLLLSIPQQVITWILRDEYINGTPFTMDGNNVLIEEVKKITITEGARDPVSNTGGESGQKRRGKVVPFKMNPK